MISHNSIRLFFVVLVLTFPCLAHALPSYKVLDLGTLGGSTSYGYGINDAGQVTGESLDIPGSFGKPRAFRASVSNGAVSMVNLGTLGGNESYGYGINNSGQVAGRAKNASAAAHAFLFGLNGMIDLGTLGGTYSSGYGINDSGQVTGQANTDGNAAYRAFLAHESNGQVTMIDLGTLGGTSSYGVGINNLGQVTGQADTAENSSHAFLYGPGGMIDLGTLGGALSSGQDINDSGQVTGFSSIDGNTIHAFITRESNGQITMIDLGTLGGAYSSGAGINSSGLVVGSSTLNTGFSRAFIYDQTFGMKDLNDFLAPGFEHFVFDGAYGINDKGWIVGTGRTPDGQNHALLAYTGDLNPTAATPEPASMLLMGVGTAGIAFMRRRKMISAN